MCCIRVVLSKARIAKSIVVCSPGAVEKRCCSKKNNIRKKYQPVLPVLPRRTHAGGSVREKHVRRRLRIPYYRKAILSRWQGGQAGKKRTSYRVQAVRFFLRPAASKRRVPRWPPSTKRIRRAGWGRRFWALWGKQHSNGQNRNPDLANRQEAILRCRDRRESRNRRRKSPPQPPGTSPPAPDPGLSRPQCCPGGSSPQFRKGISTKTDSNGLDGQLAKKSFKVTGQIQIIAPSHSQDSYPFRIIDFCFLSSFYNSIK